MTQSTNQISAFHQEQTSAAKTDSVMRQFLQVAVRQLVGVSGGRILEGPAKSG